MKIYAVSYFFIKKHNLNYKKVLKFLQRAEIVKSVVLRGSDKQRSLAYYF